MLDPVEARIGAGERQAYTAKVRIRTKHPDLYSDSLDVTGLTRFKIMPDGSCTKLRGKVSCSATNLGPHTVTGTLPPRLPPPSSIPPPWEGDPGRGRGGGPAGACTAAGDDSAG